MKQTTMLRYWSLNVKDLAPRTKSITLHDPNLKESFGQLSKAVQNRLINQGVGIEVEVEHNPRVVITEGWESVEDNSLRNAGVEYRTIYGTRLAKASNSLDDLFTFFNAYRKDVDRRKFDFSERTSIHVHLDVRNLTVDELVSLMMVYTIFEDGLFKFAGEHRKDNVFCIPVRQLPMQVHESDNLSNLVDCWSKYVAMNIQPIASFGTVEFRHMEGNSDYSRVMTWVILLALMVDYVRTHKRQEIETKIHRLKMDSNYSAFAEEVFQTFQHWLSYSDDLDSAVSDAKLFSLMIKTNPLESDALIKILRDNFEVEGVQIAPPELVELDPYPLEEDEDDIRVVRGADW